MIEQGSIPKAVEKVWLLGDGRSGTTWIMKLINHESRYITMFEPFHPEKIQQISDIKPNLFVPSEATNDVLKDFYKRVFEGDYIDPRISSKRKISVGLGVLVKDIFANLMAHSVCRQFSEVKPILLIRNPFAVAVSKLKKESWSWANTPNVFLNQVSLNEYLSSEHLTIISRLEKSNNPFMNQILTWAIINYIPLRQFSSDELQVIFYEHFYLNATEEICRLNHYINCGDCSTLPRDLLCNPVKKNDFQSNLVHGKSPLSAWREVLSGSQMNDANVVLESFGLAGLYSSADLPDVKALNHFGYFL